MLVFDQLFQRCAQIGRRGEKFIHQHKKGLAAHRVGVKSQAQIADHTAQLLVIHAQGDINAIRVAHHVRHRIVEHLLANLGDQLFQLFLHLGVVAGARANHFIQRGQHGIAFCLPHGGAANIGGVAEQAFLGSAHAPCFNFQCMGKGAGQYGGKGQRQCGFFHAKSSI